MIMKMCGTIIAFAVYECILTCFVLLVILQYIMPFAWQAVHPLRWAVTLPDASSDAAVDARGPGAPAAPVPVGGLDAVGEKSRSNEDNNRFDVNDTLSQCSHSQYASCYLMCLN